MTGRQIHKARVVVAVVVVVVVVVGPRPVRDAAFLCTSYV